MTALSGVAGSSPRSLQRRECAQSIANQSLYSRCPAQFADARGASFGASIHPNATLDRRAIFQMAGSDTIIVAADARIDNSDELLAALGGNLPGLAENSCDLIAAAWHRWGDDAFGRLIGSFAIAIFDERDQRLILARSPSFDRPLCYRIDEHVIRFASMPSGLFGDRPIEPDMKALSRLIIHGDLAPGESCFAGVRQVLPGHFLEWQAGRARSVRFWHPPPVDLGYTGDALEEFRHILELAVECRLRRQGGRVASHLSGGFDSSAVTAFATRLIDDRRSLIAYTAIPSRDLHWVVPPKVFADESMLAAETARTIGVEHRLVACNEPLLDGLIDHARFYQAPVPNLPNHGWGQAIEEDASRSGATVLLSATRGNATISYGNVDILSEWLRHGLYLDYLRQIRKLTARKAATWRGALFYSLDEVVPEALWNRLAGNVPDTAERLFIQPQWLDHGGRAASARDACGPGVRAIQYEVFANGDMGVFTKGVLAKSGLDERDPGGDIRLAEFGLRLPPQAYLNDGATRRLARVGLRGILPKSITDQKRRGYQGADWFARLDQKRARHWLEEISASSTAAALLDLRRLERAVDEIPTLERLGPARLREWGSHFTRALAVGAFLRECEHEGARIGRKMVNSSSASANMVEQEARFSVEH